MGPPQAVFVFQITEANTHPFQLTAGTMEKALLEARLKARRARVRVGTGALEGAQC